MCCYLRELQRSLRILGAEGDGSQAETIHARRNGLERLLTITKTESFLCEHGVSEESAVQQTTISAAIKLCFYRSSDNAYKSRVLKLPQGSYHAPESNYPLQYSHLYIYLFFRTSKVPTNILTKSTLQMVD